MMTFLHAHWEDHASISSSSQQQYQDKPPHDNNKTYFIHHIFLLTFVLCKTILEESHN